MTTSALTTKPVFRSDPRIAQECRTTVIGTISLARKQNDVNPIMIISGKSTPGRDMQIDLALDFAIGCRQ